jgi:hypothetical protein
LLIYCHTVTSRLKYITAFAGIELIGQPIELTTSPQVFAEYTGPKINYSTDQIGEGYSVEPHPLIFEDSIKQQETNCFLFNGLPAFFKTKGDFPFDVFAACFYLLSRYEEYLPHRKDSYGRYAHENSLAFRENFLHLPVINMWLKEFSDSLRKRFPELQIHSSKFEFIPTYDIDEAYSYKHKAWWRIAGAIVKSLLKGELRKIRERIRVLGNRLPDPFDSYAVMDNLHQQHQLKPRYFFLIAQNTGKYDRNILPENRALVSLIKEHARKYEIGIHPSWQSGDDSTLLEKEIIMLEKLSSKKITTSRQHFIRFTLPGTYRQLIKYGINQDYSMGYGSINGFRASVASEFLWYDLEKEEQTSLRLFPFCFMEANAFFEQKITAEQALDEMRSYYKTVRAVNGLMITIWHNTFLGTDKMFKGWREIYERFLEEM